MCSSSEYLFNHISRIATSWLVSLSVKTLSRRSSNHIYNFAVSSVSKTLPIAFDAIFNMLSMFAYVWVARRAGVVNHEGHFLVVRRARGNVAPGVWPGATAGYRVLKL